MKMNLEHNLSDIELFEVLEKSAKAISRVFMNSERLKDQVG